jgi:hypothetical protein
LTARPAVRCRLDEFDCYRDPAGREPHPSQHPRVTLYPAAPVPDGGLATALQGPAHIFGVSKIAYVLATSRSLQWRYDLLRTSTLPGSEHPIGGVMVLLGRPNDGNYDLWL